jgi:hypothetical protein
LTSHHDKGTIYDTNWQRSGFVKGLRKPVQIEGSPDVILPVKVMKVTSESQDKIDLAEMREDVVIAAKSTAVVGMERAIVVYVQCEENNEDELAKGRFEAMSRCSSQLVWVKWRRE